VLFDDLSLCLSLTNLWLELLAKKELTRKRLDDASFGLLAEQLILEPLNLCRESLNFGLKLLVAIREMTDFCLLFGNREIKRRV